MSDRPTAVDRFRTAQLRLLVASGRHGPARGVRVRDGYAHSIGAGAGNRVVRLGGDGWGAATWARLLADLEGSHHVFAADRPGCGLSDPLTTAGASFRDQAAGFVEELLDALGAASASLVGSGMGGYWALAFALAHPERTDRLALLGAPAGSAGRPALRARLLATPVLGALVPDGVPGRSRRRLPTALARRRLVAHPERLVDPMLDVIHAGWMLPGVRRAHRATARAIARPWRTSRLTHALRDDLGRLEAPTPPLWGEGGPRPEPPGRAVAPRLRPAS